MRAESHATAARIAPARPPAEWLVAGGVALTVAVGLGAEARGHELGTPLPPFLAGFDPGAGSWTVPAVVVLGGALLAVRRWARQAPAAAFAGGALLLALALRLALGAARDGPAGWWAVFDTSFEAKNEYLPALPALDYGVGVFLDRFAEVGTSLPVHAVGHPPGLLVLMHGLGIESPEALAALVIGTGALSVPLVYLLGRRLLDERRARMAALLYLFAPSALVYGATSADALFVTAGLIAALGLSAGSRAVRATAGAGALAVASFFSWALLAIGAWAALLVWRREGPRAALALSAACAAALAAFYAALYAASGFDPLGALQSAEQVYRLGIASSRPYEFWVFGSPAAFLVALGIPTAWYAARALGGRDNPALALAAVIAVAALLGFTKAETERIWLPFVPLACLAAASVLPRERLLPVLSLLAAQALAAELLLGTVW